MKEVSVCGLSVGKARQRGEETGQTDRHKHGQIDRETGGDSRKETTEFKKDNA